MAMELDIIKTDTTWNDAAGSVNKNFSKLKQAIATLIAEGGGLDEEQLAAYLQANGYTTEQWIALQGFIKLGSLDTEIKADSVNAVQNKVIKAYADKVAQEAGDAAIRGALEGLSADEIYIKYIENKMSLLLAQDGGLGTPEGMQGLGIISIPEGLLSDYAKNEEISNTFATIAALNLVNGRLTAIEDYFSSEEDADTLINKWNEIVAFLNATEGTTLDNILSSKANRSDIPTRVGQLENDKGYITSAALEGYLKLSGGTLSGSIDFGRHPLLSVGAEFLLSLGGATTYLKGSTGIWLETPELYTTRDNRSYRVLDLGMDIDAKTLGGLAETAFYRGRRASINVSDLDTYVSRDVGAYSVEHSGHTSALLVLSKLTSGSNTSVEIYAPSYIPSLGLRLRFGIDSNRYSDWRDFAFLDDTIYAAYKLVNSRGDDIVTINSYNNVIIGASGADSANYKLYVDGDIRAKNAIKIGDAIISWDNERSALKIVGNVYATGQVAAGGFGNSDGGSGGGVILDYDSVVAALGFTPFDSAAFTKISIQNALGIADWALAANKPLYNFSEIGSKPTTLSGYGITDAYTKGTADSTFLKLGGGTMTSGAGIYNAANSNTSEGAIGFNSNHNAFGSTTFATKIRSSINPTVKLPSGEFAMLHSGNFGDFNLAVWSDNIDVSSNSSFKHIGSANANNGWTSVGGPAMAFGANGSNYVKLIFPNYNDYYQRRIYYKHIKGGVEATSWGEIITKDNFSEYGLAVKSSTASWKPTDSGAYIGYTTGINGWATAGIAVALAGGNYSGLLNFAGGTEGPVELFISNYHNGAMREWEKVLTNKSIGTTSLPSLNLNGETITSWAGLKNYLSFAFSEITGKPTTLDGYGITDAVYRSDNFDATSAKPWVLGYSNSSYGWKATGPAMLFGTGGYYARLNVAQEGTDNPTAHLSLVHAGVEYGWAKVLTEKNIRSHAIEIVPASERRATTDYSAFATYAYGDNGWITSGPALAFSDGNYKGLLNISIGNGESAPARLWIGSVREGTQQPWVEVLTEKSQGVMRGRGRLAEADADTLSEAGVYEFWGGGAISNVPSGYSTMLVSRGADNNLYFTSQLLTDAQGHLYSRMSEGYTLNWRPWRTIIDDNNISSYAISQSAADSRYLKLIGGTVSGQIFIKTASNDRFFRSQSDSYDLGFGVGSGGVNRGIFDFTNSQWWIVRGSGIDTLIYGDVNIDGLLTANRGIRVASGQALSFIDAGGTEHSITYDSAANAFKVDGSMYALGQLAAGEKGEEHKKVFDISSTATSTEYVITHNFQTYEVSVAVYKVTPATGSTSEIWTQVIVDIEITSADSIKVSFYSKPLNTAYKVVVIG